MILQLAHHIAAKLGQQGYPGVEIRVRAPVSLNGRRMQDLIDPTTDLTTRHRSIWPADWILPLTEPLPSRVTNGVSRSQVRRWVSSLWVHHPFTSA